MAATENSKPEAARLRSIPGDPLCQNILPLVHWVEAEEQSGSDGCPPCGLATIAPWYRSLLAKKGYADLAAKVQSLADGEHEPSEVASVLDEIKDAVKDDEDVERELLLYDCMMQKYEEEES